MIFGMEEWAREIDARIGCAIWVAFAVGVIVGGGGVLIIQWLLAHVSIAVQ